MVSRDEPFWFGIVVLFALDMAALQLVHDMIDAYVNDPLLPGLSKLRIPSKK